MKLKLPRKLLGFILGCVLVMLAGLIVPAAKVGAVCIAIPALYATFAGSHTVSDVLAIKTAPRKDEEGS